MAKKEETKKAEEPKKVEETKKVETAKKEEPKKVEEKKTDAKAKYSIAVTGFYSLGKMFRPKGGNEIDAKRYSKQIPEWLKKGYIR